MTASQSAYIAAGLKAVKSELDALPFHHTPNFDDLEAIVTALLRYVVEHPPGESALPSFITSPPVRSGRARST